MTPANFTTASQRKPSLALRSQQLSQGGSSGGGGQKLSAYDRANFPARRRLARRDVKYIVFEGGGGKGFAYSGALQALQDKRVIGYIEPDSGSLPTSDGQKHSRLDFTKTYGVGGASVGAITALLVSIGYTPTELSDLMKQKEKFLAFFDGGFNGKAADGTQVQRLVPVYGGALPVQDTKQLLKKAGATLVGLLTTLGLARYCVAFWPLLIYVVDIMRDKIKQYGKTPPFDALLANWQDFAVNFDEDWGFFAGYAARQLFDQLLAARLPLGQDGKPQANATFEQHLQYFQVELLVTGTNIETGKSVVFSARDTPKFSVADAVRISMGVPLVFKPVRIQDDATIAKIGPDSRGVWVDGGLLNNVPFREFDDRPGANPKTLALRLELEQVTSLTTLKQFAANYFALALFGPGESFVSSAHQYQSIVLDTRGLSLLDFAPDQRVVSNVMRAAYHTVEQYFDPTSSNKPSLTTLSD